MSPPPLQHPYRIPAALRDLVLVDLLELTGSTSRAASVMGFSQPSVSRRYRRLAHELHLGRRRDAAPGRGYGDAAWMALLRQGVNCHRLACGVLRLGGSEDVEPLLQLRRRSEWIPLPAAALEHLNTWLDLELLDGLVLHPQQLPASEVRRPLFKWHTNGSQTLWLLCRSEPLVLHLAASLTTNIG